MITTEDEYIKTNRQKRQEPKSGLWWCGNCDGALVGNGSKCPKCKAIQGKCKKVTLKKETNA